MMKKPNSLLRSGPVILRQVSLLSGSFLLECSKSPLERQPYVRWRLFSYFLLTQPFYLFPPLMLTQSSRDCNDGSLVSLVKQSGSCHCLSLRSCEVFSPKRFTSSFLHYPPNGIKDSSSWESWQASFFTYDPTERFSFSPPFCPPRRYTTT